MNQPKWTPGPWRHAAKASSVVGLPVIGPMGAAIANVHARDEMMANAALIAAAPELAAALERLLGDFDEHPNDFTADWHTARAALASAKGEQP